MKLETIIVDDDPDEDDDEDLFGEPTDDDPGDEDEDDDFMGDGLSARTPESEWRWFGHAGHLIVGNNCRFHLCTQVGAFLVSTVGEYVPDETSREIHCQVRGIVLEGRGDYRLADYMQKVGFQEIGYGRTYQTMVFRVRDVCHAPGCGCGLPTLDSSDLDMRGYRTAGAATLGHLELCRQYATNEAQATGAVDPPVADPGTPTTRD